MTEKFPISYFQTLNKILLIPKFFLAFEEKVLFIKLERFEVDRSTFLPSFSIYIYIFFFFCTLYLKRFEKEKYFFSPIFFPFFSSSFFFLNSAHHHVIFVPRFIFSSGLLFAATLRLVSNGLLPFHPSFYISKRFDVFVTR